jgi:hypothetical protein
MTTSTLRFSALAATLIVAAACSDKAKSRAATDSALARDLALAGQQTAQPTFQDTSIAPAPTPAATAKQNPPAPVQKRTAQAPKPAAPQRVAQAPAPTPVPAPVSQLPAPTVAAIHGEIGAGTGVALTSGSKVCTSTNLPGDKLVATVNETITGSNGAVIPAGSTVVLEVASVTTGDNADGAQIAFRVRSVVVNDKTYNVSAEVAPTTPLEKSKMGDPNADKKKVIGGAIAGALIGQMIGHNTKGTVIGAATGAAAGAVASRGGQKLEGCLPSGAGLKLTLNSGLVMS